MSKQPQKPLAQEKNEENYAKASHTKITQDRWWWEIPKNSQPNKKDIIDREQGQESQ